MPPSIEELVDRYNKLTSGLDDAKRLDRAYSPVDRNFNSRDVGGMVIELGPLFEEDAQVLTRLVEAIIAGFKDVTETAAAPHRASFFAPLRARALAQFDDLATKTGKIREERLRRGKVIAFARPKFPDIRPQLRDMLEARMDVILGRADAGLEHDTGVQRRARNASLFIALCGVVLSAVITVSVQLHKESADSAARIAERRYGLRAEIIRSLTPTLSEMALVASRLSLEAPQSDTSRVLQVRLRRLIDVCDSLKVRAGPQFAVAFGDSVIARVDTLLSETSRYQRMLDTLTISGDSLHIISHTTQPTANRKAPVSVELEFRSSRSFQRGQYLSGKLQQFIYLLYSTGLGKL